ncbi:DUF6458 family protein [Pseudomonas sp. URMO17WK12:I12]|uniref:DUF6458 family protein n=1 Tax=Pseudomonas sp. URMO17WK12:I12 TaxID=1259797 RepID=UPI000481E3CF|nr:DUF6458 family protein [Pseudomonas sp. URMO17WK12:I12]
MDESNKHLEQIRQSTIFRWAQAVQWFGLITFLLAVGLALLTDLPQSINGITLIAILGMLGLLSLVPARFILTVYLMTPSKKNKSVLTEVHPSEVQVSSPVVQEKSQKQ